MTRRRRRGHTAMARIGVAAIAIGAIGLGCGGHATGPRPPCQPTAVARIVEAADLAALAACPRLGGVTVRTAVTFGLDGLASLEEVAGDLVVGPTIGVDVIELPRLVRVGGRLRIAGNSALTGVFLPQLRTAARVEIEHNAALASVSLPRLREAGVVSIVENAGLEVVSMESLAQVKELGLVGLPRLGLLRLDGLRKVARWQLGDLPALRPGEQAELAELRRRVTAAP